MAQSPLALSGDFPLETDKGLNMDFVWFAPFGIHLNYLGWDLDCRLLQTTLFPLTLLPFPR